MGSYACFSHSWTKVCVCNTFSDLLFLELPPPADFRDAIQSAIPKLVEMVMLNEDPDFRVTGMNIVTSLVQDGASSFLLSLELEVEIYNSFQQTLKISSKSFSQQCQIFLALHWMMLILIGIFVLLVVRC